MQVPRLVLAGTHSGAGKTSLTLGLLAALKKLGHRVRPFKVGPDYIDPGLHRVAAGRHSHNLDAWMGSEKVVQELFYRHARNCDLAVVEGVMGLFDGAGGGDQGSTAHVARILEAPVVLVVSARGMARSCGALVKGYRDYDPRVNVAGVIFNQVGSPGQARILKQVVEEEQGIPVLGAVQRQPDLTMPERHLGLLPAAEHDKIGEIVDKLAQAVEEGVDLGRVVQLARLAPPIKPPGLDDAAGEYKVKVAVAWDEAFNFYYRDNLDYLVELGAELVYFSPLRDASLPLNIDGVYLGGGFPEMFLPDLAQNAAMHESLRHARRQGLPIYAECGGFMYLLEEIVDFRGKRYSGVGLVPGFARMQQRLAALGYVVAEPLRDSILARPGDKLKGHEFHYSKSFLSSGRYAAYKLYGGKGEQGRADGYARDNILASYVHLHFRSNPTAAKRFLRACLGGGKGE